MRDFKQYITEGVYDPNIFKAFFLAGGPGSGKSWVSERTLSGMGLKVINSDNLFARALEKESMSLNMATTDEKEIARRDAIRTKAKARTGVQLKLALEGRLGLILDSTARDVSRISDEANTMKQIGYDVYMIFVNTSLDVALERNKKRERSVPEYITRKSWQQVQSNIGKFQNTFGMGNMIIIDNSKDEKELTNQIMDRCSKAVRRLLSNKIKSYTAKRWMATERRLKRR